MYAVNKWAPYDAAPEYEGKRFKEKRPGAAAVAWYVYGHELEPDEDTEWSGISNRTGRVLASMVGDDQAFAVDIEDLEIIDDKDYCSSCGQIGCTHDGRDRDEG